MELGRSGGVAVGAWRGHGRRVSGQRMGGIGGIGEGLATSVEGGLLWLDSFVVQVESGEGKKGKGARAFQGPITIEFEID